MDIKEISKEMNNIKYLKQIVKTKTCSMIKCVTCPIFKECQEHRIYLAKQVLNNIKKESSWNYRFDSRNRNEIFSFAGEINMDIKEISKDKSTLQKKTYNLIKSFEEKSGMTITDITFYDEYKKDDEWETSEEYTGVKLDTRLFDKEEENIKEVKWIIKH